MVNGTFCRNEALKDRIRFMTREKTDLLHKQRSTAVMNKIIANAAAAQDSILIINGM